MWWSSNERDNSSLERKKCYKHLVAFHYFFSDYLLKSEENLTHNSLKKKVEWLSTCPKTMLKLQQEFAQKFNIWVNVQENFQVACINVLKIN